MPSPRRSSSGDSDDFVHWSMANRNLKTSIDDFTFLRHRVRKLREDERKAVAEIEQAKAKNRGIVDAQERAVEKKKAAADHRRRELEQLEAARINVARLRQATATAVTDSQAKLQRSKSKTRDSVRAQRAASAGRAKVAVDEDSARRQRRCARIKEAMEASAKQRDKFHAKRSAALHDVNRKEADKTLGQRDHNVNAAAELMLVEADIMRSLVQLRVQSAQVVQTTAQLLSDGDARSDGGHTDHTDMMTTAS